jgi:hypothetical protein
MLPIVAQPWPTEALPDSQVVDIGIGPNWRDPK